MSIPTRQKIMADQSDGMEWIVALWFRTQDVEMVLHAHDSIETIAICSEALSSHHWKFLSKFASFTIAKLDSLSSEFFYSGVPCAIYEFHVSIPSGIKTDHSLPSWDEVLLSYLISIIDEPTDDVMDTVKLSKKYGILAGAVACDHSSLGQFCDQ
jgi:hypothetical protein